MLSTIPHPTDFVPVAVPPDVLEVMERVRATGHRVWLVGGAVRDALAGRIPHDWDLATDLPVTRVRELFRSVVPVGLQHGTVLVHHRGRDVEVTQCPALGEEGILRDLARRDFTVNAMAVRHPEGTLLDPHGGREDLAGGLLRGVGDPTLRFREDPLRTLRAARLMATLGFDVEPATRTALAAESHGLAGVAAERISAEMHKLVMGDRIVDAFELMRSGGALAVIFPEILEGCGVKADPSDPVDRFHRGPLVAQRAPRRLRVRLAALLHALREPPQPPSAAPAGETPPEAEESARVAGEVLERWRFPVRITREVQELVRCRRRAELTDVRPAAVRRLMARIGTKLLDDLLDLEEARVAALAPDGPLAARVTAFGAMVAEQRELGVPLQLKDLAVNGADLTRALDLKPGPHVGRILQRLLDFVLEHPEHNRRELLLQMARDGV